RTATRPLPSASRPTSTHCPPPLALLELTRQATPVSSSGLIIRHLTRSSDLLSDGRDERGRLLRGKGSLLQISVGAHEALNLWRFHINGTAPHLYISDFEVRIGHGEESERSFRAGVGGGA